MFCKHCGNQLETNQQVCLKCGAIVESAKVKGGKSRIAAGVLAILLGAFGIHNFYLGYNNRGTTQLLITILSCGILSWVSAIWAIIEGISILTGSINEDAFGQPLSD